MTPRKKTAAPAAPLLDGPFEPIPRPEAFMEGLHDDNDTMRMPRCYYGRSSENPCWREAAYWEHRDRKRPVCEAHARWMVASFEADELRNAVDVTADWLRIAKGWDADALVELAQEAHDKAVERASLAAARHEVLSKIADEPRPGEGMPSLTAEQEGRLAELFRRSDGLNNAFVALQDGEGAELEAMGHLRAAADEASAEYERCRRELGLPEPGAVRDRA